MTGTVRSFRHTWGYIDGDDGNLYFVHKTGIYAPIGYRSLQPGQRVRFNTRIAKRGLQAVDVKPDTFTPEEPRVEFLSTHGPGKKFDWRKVLQQVVPTAIHDPLALHISAIENIEAEERSPAKNIRNPNQALTPPPSPSLSSITHSEAADLLDKVALRIDSADPSIARFLALRFFGGLTLKEIAAKTGQPLIEVRHNWQTAQRSAMRVPKRTPRT